MGLLTVAAVYLLILVGGIVRSTGSGMGCPDWPRCFGTWVPPTQASQLPADYKEQYTTQRVAKNKRVATTLDRLGFKQTAASLLDHPTQYIETDFNATKTWIEYINRLLGALVGVFIALTVVFALPYWRRDKTVFVLAFGSLLLTGFQGWLGSLVVSTNLLPEMVTVHMGLALVIVALLLYAVNRSQREHRTTAGPLVPAAGLTGWLWLVVVLTFAQIVLGTQVREGVDLVAAANNYGSRDQWIEQLGTVFRSHRSFSIILLLLNGYVGYRLYQLPLGSLRQLATATLSLVVAEIVAGIVLAYFALPAAIQPVHLTLAALLFGSQFMTLVIYRRATKSVRQPTYKRVVA